MISGKKALPIILLLLLSFMVIPALSSQTTMLQVDPAESHVLLNEFFNITVNVINRVQSAQNGAIWMLSPKLLLRH